MAEDAAVHDGTMTPREPRPQRLVLVTGPSGAGRSTAINVLEDLGFEAIDNLPLSLIPRLLDGPARPVPLALGLDVRNRDFSASNVIELIDRLTRSPHFSPEVLFLDCNADMLVRRYNETRRRHPLSPDSSPLSGVTAEIDLLAPIRVRADVLVDTTDLSPHDLKAELTHWFAIRQDDRLSLSLHSFSYKRGVPRGVDLMFDCRCLANPHWDTGLRQLTGRDRAVQDYVCADPRYAEFFDRIRDLILFLLPAHLDEGKTHLAVGFGCTGGQHRSVTLVEKMAVALAEAGWPVSIRHRELERRVPVPSSSGEGRAGEAAAALSAPRDAAGLATPGLGETR
ncbi:RNase adapter RapZ [Paracoccus spongiarum]|uniref:RNase adapter RapZ n=1 Tax=Paracoccus spongiarum TaxID=3064387 RepID=A0ABT9JAE7_9RHOB|nr:RNase adapter RapZ [Paracoccus sp. 2205BS29-5]MDP5306792.1 RNase adapter RapZ [Paracoccus sp. 2205BS29-5]